MKLRLPHKFQAALLAAIASVSFTTLSTGTLGAAFFVSGQAFAEDAEEDPSATIDIGDTNLDAQAAMEEEEGTAEKEPGSAPINEAGFNGGPGNNAGLLITESVDIDETALDTVVSSEPVAATSGSADSTPSDNLGFTANPYATGSDTSNGSDEFSLTDTAPAAAYVPGQSGVYTEEGDSAAGIGSGSSTNKTTTGAIGSIGGTGSGAIGGRVARPMALTAPNLLSPVSSLSVDGTSLGGDSGSAPSLLAGQLTAAANEGSSITLHVNSTPAWETGTGKPKTVYEYLYSTFNEGGTLTFDMSLTWDGNNCGQYQELLHVGAKETGFYIAANGGPHLLVGPKNDHSGTYELSAASLTANTLTPITVTLTNKAAGTASVQITLGGNTYNMTDLTWSSMNWNASDEEKWKYAIGCGASGWDSWFPVQNQTILNNDIVATYTAPDVDNLVWNGTPESSVWDTDAQNWTKDGEPTAFASGDNATFSSTGNKTVLIQSAISARTVSVSDNYTFSLSGSGALNAHGIDIASGCTLTVQGGVVTTGVLAGAGTLNIASGAEVDNASTTAFSGVKLSGQGLYVVAGTTSMTAGFNSDWTGTVQLKNVGNFNDGNLAAFANSSLSTVELKGVTGWTSQWQNGHLDFDIKLTNNGNNSAWNFTGGASGGKQAITLNGVISGSGTLEKTNNNNQGFVFTGNLSDWNGAFKQNNTATSFITFKGSASEVNAQILRANGTLNVNVGDGGTSFSTRFNKGVQANTFTVNANASATLTKASTLGQLAGTGSFTINSGSEMVSAAGGSIGSVDVQSGTFRLISSLTTAGNFTVASGATLQYNSKLVGLTVEGNLSFATGASLNVGNIEYFAGKSYTLATATGSISYDSASLLSGLAMPTGATNYTLATSESGGTTSLTLTFDGTTPPTKTLHLYILTGQSNSLGAVKRDPASPATLAQYSTVRDGDNNGILMWNGNMAGSVSQNEPSKNLIVPNEGKVWQTVAPQEPNYNGNNCTGPEYGFAYMMQHKGWNVSDSSDVAIIKGSRDGGGNDQWVKGQPLYGLLLDTVKTAIKNVDTDGYSTIQLDGLMYLQGESNGETPDAANRFSTFITNFKADLQAAMQTDPELAAKASMITISLGSEILGEPASWGALSSDTITTTSSQLYSLSTQKEGWGFVYTHDLDKINPDDGYHVHYDGNSEIAIGARYAYSMAIGQRLDVTDNGNIRVRSQYYGDTFSTQSASSDKDTYEPVSLNDAKAWWRNADESGWTTAALSNQVAVWDISSANMRNTAQGKETLSADLALKGIRIEDPYAEDDSLGTNHATIVIDNAAGTGTHTLSVGAEGIKLQQGNLTVNTNLTATANQTWNTNDTPANGSAQQNTLTLAGTTTIATGATVTIEGASIVDISTLAGTGGLTVNGAGAVVTLTDKTAFKGSTTITSGSLKVAGTNDLDITGNLTINGGSATFAGNITADTVTLSNIGSGQGSFVTYNGTITGKDSITLNNYTVADMNASLVTQRLVAMGGTHTTIHNLTLTACEVTVDNGSDLMLAGHLTLGDTATYTGTLNLANGLSIDVSALNFGDMTQDVTLLSTTSGSLGSTNVNNISLDFGESPEPTSYSLVNQNNNLVLTFDAPASDVLIWNNTDGNWSNATDADLNWHTADAPATPVAFTTGKNVRFDSNAEGHTVTLTEDITAGTMTIDYGVSVTMSGGSNTLEVASIDGAGATLALNGGTVSVAQNSTVGSLSGSAALQIAKNATLTVGGTADSTYSGVISGEGGLTKTGNGTLTLNGSNTLSGHITVSGGTLKLGNKDALGSASSVSVATGGTLDIYGAKDEATVLDLTLAGGKLVNSGGEASYGSKNLFKSIELTADSEVNASGNEFGLVNGGYDSTQLALGTNTLTKTGTGTFNLVNTTVTGAGFLKAQEGSLYFNRARDSSKWGSFESNLEMAGGAVKGDIKYGAAGTIKTTADSTLEAKLHTNSSPLTFDGPRNLTVSGVISDAGSIIKTGTGIVTLSGNNSYTGGTTINAGTLVAAANGSLGTSGVTVNADGTLELKVHGTNDAGYGMPTISGTGTVKITDGNFQYHSAGYLEGFTGRVLIADGGVVQIGKQNSKFAGASTLEIGSRGTIKGWQGYFSKDILLSGGTLSDANDLEKYIGNITLAQGTSSNVAPTAGHTITLSGTISGSGNLNKTDTGTAEISGVNTYTGGTTVSAGTLKATNANALGSGTVTVNSGATLEYTSAANIGTLVNNGTVNLKGSGGGTQANIAGISGTGDINITSTSANRTYNITGDISDWTGTLTQTSGSGSMNLNISGTEELNADIVNNATGAGCNITVNLTHDMDVNGSINYISNGPVIVNVGNANTAVTATFTNSVKTSSLGIANAGSTATFKDVLNLAGNATLAGTLVVDSNSATASSISGTISGGGTLVKNGTGTLNLGGNAHTISDLTINEGVVTTTLSGQTASVSGTININGGGTFAVNGEHDAFGWGAFATSKIVMEGESGEGNMATLALKASGASTTMATNLEMKGYSQITGAAGFNSYGGNIAVSGTENTIDAMLVRSAVEVNTGIGAELTVNSLGQHSQGSGALTKSGAGTLILNGNTTNTATNVSAGTLELTSTVNTINGNLSIAHDAILKLNEMDDDAVTTSGTVTLNSGSILDLTSLSISGNEPVTLLKGGNIVDTNLSTVQVLFKDAMTKDYSLSKSGNDLVLTFIQNLIWDNDTGNATWSTDSTDKNWHTAGAPEEHISFGTGDSVKFVSTYDNTLSLGGDVEAGTMTVDTGAAVTVNTAGHSLTVAGVVLNAEGSLAVSVDADKTVNLGGSISGAGSLEKSGDGILEITNANTYTGGTTVSDGTLKVTNANGLGTDATVTVGDGAILEYTVVANIDTLVNNGTVNLKGSGGGTHANIAGISGTGDINITSTSANRTYNITGDISDWTGTLTQTSGSGSMNLNISGTNALNANIVNMATTSADCVINLNLKDSMTVGGEITYTDKGPVKLTLGDGSKEVDATFKDNVKVSSFNMANANSSAILQGTSEIGSLSGAGSLTVDTTDKLVSVNGSATNYTGAVEVTSGTLRTGADNALGSGAVAVNGGTLDVYGHAVTNEVTVNGGTLTNGSSTAMGVDTPGLANLTVGTNGMTVNGGRAVSVHSATGMATMMLDGDDVDVTITGSGTQLVLGDATLTGNGTISTTSGGALGLGGTTIASGSDVSIGSDGAKAHVVFYDTLVNESANTDIYGAKLTYTGNLASNVGGGTYKDTVAGSTENGFLQGGYFTLVDNQGDGAVTGNLDGSTIVANGFVHTLRETEGEDKDIVFDLLDTDINSVSDTYFINSGTLTYNAADNATGLDRVASIRLNGGNLQLTNTDLKTDVTLDVLQNGTLAIGAGRTVYEETVNVIEGKRLTLTGVGTYTMRPCTLGSNASLPVGVVLGTGAGDEAFTGTVWLSKGTKLIRSSLTGLATDNSSVTFNGVTGSLTNGTIAQNIVLEDYNSIPALALTNGTTGETHTFSGTITGDGTLARSFVSGDGNKGGIQNYEFTGDVSNWNGIFDNQVNGETTNLTFSGAVTSIGATIMNGPANSAGTLNVFTAGENDKEFYQTVTASSFSAQGGNVDFLSAVNLAGNASASGDTVLTFHNKANIGGGLSGKVQVDDGGNVTVEGASSLGSLNLIGTSTTRFNSTVSASGAVTVNEGASLYLNGGGFSLGNGAVITIKDGAKVGLTGWQAKDDTRTVDSQSGVYTSGFTGGQLYQMPALGTQYLCTVESGAIFMKDGAEFLYNSAQEKSRVIVGTEGTVDIITAVYYYVAGSGTKSMDEVISEAAGGSLDYILIDNGGTFRGVTDDNKSTYGISGLQGGGTIAVGTDGTLTDSAALENFTGTILVGPGSTYATDGSVARTLTVNGGTLHATDNMTLGDNATFTNSGSGGSLVIPTVDVDADKTLEIVKRMDASLEKTGDGTLRITDTYSLGAARQPMITGDLVVSEGTVVLNSLHREVTNGDKNGIVAGDITMAGGTDIVFEGMDPLGHSDGATNFVTLKTGTEDDLTTMLFTRNGGDSDTIQHLTLTTQIDVQGNTMIGGLNLNSFGQYNKDNLGEGSYIHASGTNNVIDNTFALRKNAYFDVAGASELTLTGDMLKFTGDKTLDNPRVIKLGAGLLDLAGENSSLYAIDIQDGEVDVSGHVTFSGTADNQFLMDEGAVFAVNNGGLFEYRDWDFENNDGTTAPGTITATGSAVNHILQNADLEVSGMKLTNHNGDEQIINAALTDVQLVQNGGAGSKVTVADAKQGSTQHISKLTAATGTTVLNNATLDSATVSDGATLSLTDGKTVTLGSTIQNGGAVNLKGTVVVQDLSGFAAQSGSGYQDDIIHSGGKDASYNGFYQGNTYYLVKEEGASNLTVAGGFAVNYKGNPISVMGKEKDTNSYYFQVEETNALYYINNKTDKAEYSNRDKEHAENSMYLGYTRQVEQQETQVDTSGIVMNVNGAVLTLASNLRDEVRTITTGSSGIVANYNGTVEIGKVVTLHQSDLSGKEGVLVALVGQGTFDLDGTTLKSVSSGLTEGGTDQWHGTVRASGMAVDMDASHMGNVNSTLLFDGVKGTLESGAADETIEYTMKIALQNRTGEGAVPVKALDNTFVSNTHRVFSNSVSGSGDILMTGENASVAQSIVFTGDVSGWVGTEQDAATFETAGQGTTNLAFSGGASEVNIVIQEGEGSTLNLSVGPTNALEGQTPAQVFNGNIKASSLTAEAGANTTLKNTTAISGIIDATADNAKLHVQGTTTAQTVQVAAGSSISIQSGTGTPVDTAFITSKGGTGNAVLDGGIQLQKANDMAIIKSSTGGKLATVSHANISLAAPETPVQEQNQAPARKMLAVSGTDESDLPLLTDNTLADAIAGSTLKLENLVLSADSHVSGATGNATAGNVLIGGTVEQVMGTENTGNGKSGTMTATALTLTGTTGPTSEPVGDRLYSLDFSGMSTMASLSGDSATLLLDFTQMYTPDAWANMIRNIDYLGVNFNDAIAELNVGALQVQARGYDTNGDVATYIGYYVNDGTNPGAAVGMVVYFEVPEPTTSTLSLLALAALAARRRRK